jgi:predicted HicB family RNase H-like nuclease
MTTIKQTMLRVPENVYNKLKDEANRRGISVNELICLVLFDFVNTSSIQTRFLC